MNETTSALFGFLAGGGIGAGLYFLRRKGWPVAWALGLIALGGAVIAAALFGVMVLSGLGKGGDAGMAVITIGLFIAMGLGVALVGMFIVGGIQSRSVDKPAIRVMATVFLDALAVAALLWAYQDLILEPTNRAISNEWWAKEQQRREARKRQFEQIPPQFRDLTSAQIEEYRKQEQMMAKRGVQMPSPIPQEVENAIRNYEYGSVAPGPAPNQSRYQDAAKARRAFSIALVFGWTMGAIAVPLALSALGPKRES